MTILSDLTGVPVPRWRVPYALGLAVAHASEFWADHVTGRPPKATVTGVRLTRRTMHFDPSRSLAALGLAPRPIRQSLADAVAWLRLVGEIDGPGPARPGSEPGHLGRFPEEARARPSSAILDAGRI